MNSKASIRKINQNKYTFHDLELAIQVRSKMREHLIRFDLNNNQQFEEGQIIQLLEHLLGQSRLQVQYVIRNVFRYDTNDDGSISYDQFTNFAVQQHFGEMAIQRLHRKNYYSRGINRIMNSEQFYNTLIYSLNKIQIFPTKQYVSRLFQAVDQNMDGWVSYEDYFVFLVQYFGSKSVASSELSKNQNTRQVKQSQVSKSQSSQFCQARIARLVYSQFKITTMKFDVNKNLFLAKTQMQQILSKIFNMNYVEQEQIIQRILSRSQKIGYEQFMKEFIQIYLCQFDLKKNYPKLSKIEHGSFSLMLSKSLNFVAIKPSDSVLRVVFDKADSNKDGFISVTEYIQMIRFIFGGYKFDRRGLAQYDNQVLNKNNY